MGGNSSVSRPVVRPAPTVDPSQAKLEALLGALACLSQSERGEAVTALKAVGLEELAKALKAIVGGGSRPPERPAPPVVYTPSS